MAHQRSSDHPLADTSRCRYELIASATKYYSRDREDGLASWCAARFARAARPCRSCRSGSVPMAPTSRHGNAEISWIDWRRSRRTSVASDDGSRCRRPHCRRAPSIDETSSCRSPLSMVGPCPCCEAPKRTVSSVGHCGGCGACRALRSHVPKLSRVVSKPAPVGTSGGDDVSERSDTGRSRLGSIARCALEEVVPDE